MAKDHSKYISFGLYGGGVFGQKNFNHERLFQLLAPTKFNVFTTFVVDVWNNLGEYPWLYLPDFVQKNGKVGAFDLGQWNEPWWDRLYRHFMAAAENDMAVHHCLFTDYQSLKWRKRIEFKHCPFTDNTYGIKLAEEDSSKFYENWNRDKNTKDPKNFAWLWWVADENEECVMDQTRPSNRAGEGIMAFINRYADTAARARDEAAEAGKVLRLFVRCVNEALYRVDGNRMEMDARIQSYVRQILEARGFVPGMVNKNNPKLGHAFRMINEDESYISGYDRDYKQCYKNQKWLVKRKFWYELHGCDAVEVDTLKTKAMDMNNLICSMDGVPDEDVPAEAGKIWKKQKAGSVPMVCYKVPDQFGPNGEWQRKNLNANIEAAVPKMAAIVR